MGVPKPGSHRAMQKGCRCNMITNQFGIGVGTLVGSYQFIINPECKLHEHTTTYFDEPPRNPPPPRPRVYPERNNFVYPPPASGPGAKIIRQRRGIVVGDRPRLPLDSSGRHQVDRSEQ